MKKILLTIFILILALSSFANDRMMLIEFFTSTTCGPCASNNPILTAFLQSADLERINAIGYHMSWPAPGNDPMYLYNQTDNTTRRNYYGVNSIPQGRFDGIITLNSPYSASTFQAYYDQRVNLYSPVTLIITDSAIANDSVLVRVYLYTETLLSNPSAYLHVAIIEDSIHYPYPPGTNGEMDFHWVMRKMYPTGAGLPVTLTPGTLKVYEYKYKNDTLWNLNEISLLAFVQASNKEILNAAKKTKNFTLLPYPAYKSVPSGQSGSGQFRVRIPVKLPSYNTALTFTSEVVPANPNITVTFPNGNILTNLSDSMLVQVNSTASATEGIYQVILTATDASNKYHKTSVTYLVNKNYVTIRANRAAATFKVNGTTYGSPVIFDWTLGSTQTLSAISPQTYTQYRYIFQNWSDSGDTTHVITVNSTTGEYVANYKIQFKLQVSTNPSGIGSLVTIANGNQFHDTGSVVNVSISPTTVQFNNKTYYFNRWMGSGAGSYNGPNPNFQVTMNNFMNQIAIWDTVNVSINPIGTSVPNKYELQQNYPNPFNPVTKIEFAIPKSGQVKLKVFDISGREIQTLHNGYLNAGYYETSFSGAGLSSGIYFYRLEANTYSEIRRMALIK
ncbi:MAG: Omp28-related outer membrane protein [Ignavibacteria bacterium]|nr:Omp28-related outer membrane protein [Ignavibacteria bacterium]